VRASGRNEENRLPRWGADATLLITRHDLPQQRRFEDSGCEIVAMVQTAQSRHGDDLSAKIATRCRRPVLWRTVPRQNAVRLKRDASGEAIGVRASGRNDPQMGCRRDSANH
jgi:hypothetical protein